MKSEAAIISGESERPSIALTPNPLDRTLAFVVYLIAVGSVTCLYLTFVRPIMSPRKARGARTGCFRRNGKCIKWWYDTAGAYHERVADPCPEGC